MISVESLTHAYDRRRVVLDAVGLQVPAGSVIGLVGPNGAGKTTLMRVIATLLRPRAGRITVGGHDVVRAPAQARRVLGYLPERTVPYLELMCWEHLDLFAGAAGIAPADRPARLARALDAAGLQDRRDEPVKHLSKGLRQRLALQAALIHDPRALVLDEPTDGLDPESRGEVLASIRALARAGCAVLISSHVLSEIEQVSDRVVILVGGRRQDAAAPSGAPAFRVRVRDRIDQAQQVLAALAPVASVAREEAALRVTLAAGVADAGEVAAGLMRAGLTLTALEPIEATLARTFQDAIARSRDPGGGGRS